jgi:hypothetical protein
MPPLGWHLGFYLFFTEQTGNDLVFAGILGMIRHLPAGTCRRARRLARSTWSEPAAGPSVAGPRLCWPAMDSPICAERPNAMKARAFRLAYTARPIPTVSPVRAVIRKGRITPA